MVDRFEPQEFGDNFANNPDLKTLCKDLHNIWVELDLDSSVAEQEKQQVIQEVSALVQTKLVSVRTTMDHRLKKHRVLKLRAELEQWWIKCHFSEEQKHEFEPYLSQDFTDDLLTVHEQELMKLKRYFADNNHLFEVMDEYLRLYDQLLALEARDKDPDRLFDNRGGQLLKDERDRKAARKNLPALGRQVATLTEEFERRHGRPFTRDGVGFTETIALRAKSFKENRATPAPPNPSVSGAKRKRTPNSLVKLGGLARHGKMQKMCARTSARKTLL